MKPEDQTRNRLANSPASTGPAPVPAEFLGSLLTEVPDPVVITNAAQQVVFLNCAAEKLFSGSLRPGDPCPLCSGNLIIGGSVAGTPRCPQSAEVLKHVPAMLKTRWLIGAPLSLSATPIRSADDQKTGCFILIREHTDMLIHPVMQQQMATLASIL
jgi:hypothetical protein